MVTELYPYKDYEQTLSTLIISTSDSLEIAFIIFI